MSVTLGGIALPDDISWVDELDWEPVTQAMKFTLSGVPIIEESATLGGQPMTLGRVWVSRTTVLALRALAVDAGETHTLSLRGTDYDVVFRRPLGVQATPVIPYAEPDPDDDYELTLNLLRKDLS